LAFAGEHCEKVYLCITAALTIALGVGASTPSQCHQCVLLRPLPSKSDQLVIIPTDMHNRGVKDFPFPTQILSIARSDEGRIPRPRGRVHVPLTLTGDDGMPEQVHMGFVTTNYFQS